MSEHANKRNNYFNRKRSYKNKNRGDSEDNSRGSTNYQRLVSNSSNKSESNKFNPQSNPIILKYVTGGETNTGNC